MKPIDVIQPQADSCSQAQEPVDRSSSGPSRGFVPFPESETERSITERFEQQVTLHPNRIAVDGRTGSITYEALNRWANRVGRAILAVPAEGNQRTLGLLLQKGAPTLAALMGALKAGQIYVPLDPAHPQARASKMLENAGAELIVCDDANYDAVRKLGTDSRRVLNIDRLDSNLSEENLGLAAPSDSLAYIIYTSGSTGEPKGVTQNHRNVLHHVRRQTNSLHISSDDRLTWLASISTAQAMTDLYSALLNGATLCPFALKEDGLARLPDWLRQKEISIYHSSASIFRHLLDAMSSKAEYPRLRLVKLGSEQVFRKDVEGWKKQFSPSCIFVNALSSSEAGMVRQIFLDHQTLIHQPVVPVGFAIEGMEVLLLDAAGRRVDFGSVGEIAIRSRYLTPGYWQRPELTRAAFPFDLDGADTRTFLTGDLGRMSPGGCLEYLGRKDLQVKINGFRVEIAEVEAALLDACELKHAAVVAREASPGVTRLRAFVVPKTDRAPTLESIRSSMKGRLPEHMIPSEFGLVRELPLTPSGKVDRQSLASTTVLPLKADASYVGPSTPLEWQIVEIWKELLDARPIGIRHDFFELGGDSLLAVRMIDRVEGCLGMRFPLTALDSRVTVENVAQVLLDPNRTEFQSPLVALQREGSRKPFFLLHGDYEGGGFYCRRLVSRLGEDQPFYALLPHGLDGGPIPKSIEAMAADRLRVLLDYQPTGPYVLGGYCSGGLVAFEMARQLQERGLEVDRLLIIDASALNVHYRWLWSLISFLGSGLPANLEAPINRFSLSRRMMIVLEELSRRGRRVAAHSIAGILSKVLKRRLMPANNGSRVEAPLLRWLDRQKAHRAYRHAVLRYIPGPYSGRVVLFRTNELHLRAPNDPTAGWRHVASNLEVCPIPGDHHTCVTQHLESLADCLAMYLRE
jgi:amino acid adenylation domain-containing protein